MPGLLRKRGRGEKAQLALWRPKDKPTTVFTTQSLAEVRFPVSDELFLLISTILADSVRTSKLTVNIF